MTKEEFRNLKIYDHVFTKDGKCWWVRDTVYTGTSFQNIDDYKDIMLVVEDDEIVKDLIFNG